MKTVLASLLLTIGCGGPVLTEPSPHVDARLSCDQIAGAPERATEDLHGVGRLRFGMSSSVVQQVLPCSATYGGWRPRVDASGARLLCSGDTSADVGFRASSTDVRFCEDRVCSIVAYTWAESIIREDYPRILRALLERFGAPSTSQCPPAAPSDGPHRPPLCSSEQRHEWRLPSGARVLLRITCIGMDSPHLIVGYTSPEGRVREQVRSPEAAPSGLGRPAR
jgi:hypothetical protein